MLVFACLCALLPVATRIAEFRGDRELGRLGGPVAPRVRGTGNQGVRSVTATLVTGLLDGIAGFSREAEKA